MELRYAARTLRKTPGFAATAILTLALGIGASTAVFTVVDSVLLQPLGFRDSGRLVACWERVQLLRDDATGPNPRHVEVWRQRGSTARFLSRRLDQPQEHLLAWLGQASRLFPPIDTSLRAATP